MNKESMLFRTHEIKSDLIINKFSNPMQSLFFYIKDDDFQQFKEIMEKYCIHTECIDPEGNTLLNLAVQCSSYTIINYLLNKGAQVNVYNVNYCF